jgi:hypothetical protein
VGGSCYGYIWAFGQKVKKLGDGVAGVMIK